MAQQVFLPLDDVSGDLVMRLTEAEAYALHKLLASLTYDEMLAKGLTLEQAGLITNVTHVAY